MRSWKLALGISTILIIGVVAGFTPSLAEAESTAEVDHVHIDDFDFVPDDLIIRPGDQVEWHNHDSAAHTATDDDSEWDTGMITNGESVTLTFPDSGTWSYHCAFHPDMTADLTVNALPLAAIDSPQDGAQVDGQVTIDGTAADPDGTIQEVEVRIDGGDWQTTTGTTDWSYEWDTTLAPNGERLLEARAYDGLEHSELAAITVDVANPTFLDLEISSDDLSAQPGPVSTPIEITVHNHGNIAAASFAVTVEYAYNGEDHLIEEIVVENLAGFSSQTLSVEWDTLGKIGDFEVTATADADGETGDVDPANNEASTTVSILLGGVDGIDLFDP